MPTLAQKGLAEATSAFALIFIGAGAVLANDFTSGGVGLLGIALAHGLVLMAMIYAFGHISGAHVNPAVTISMLITKRIPVMTGIVYIIAQLIGASLAGFMLATIFTSAPASLAVGTTQLAAGISFETGILLEAILTFFLVITIFGVAVDKRAPPGMAGLAIGLVLTFDIIVGGALTGAAMNPARAFGPAVAAGFWDNHLVYWIGPIIGAIVAAVLYSFLLRKEDDDKTHRQTTLKKM